MAALPQGAGDGQPAAHQPDQRPADGQAQASAAKAWLGHATELLKLIEDASLVLWRYADAGICHFKLNPNPPRLFLT